jgi:hypothetical protein
MCTQCEDIQEPILKKNRGKAFPCESLHLIWLNIVVDDAEKGEEATVRASGDGPMGPRFFRIVSMRVRIECRTENVDLDEIASCQCGYRRNEMARSLESKVQEYPLPSMRCKACELGSTRCT